MYSMTMVVVPRSLGSWSTEGLGELQNEAMVLSSQLLKMLQELTLSEEKNQMTALG